MKRVFNIIVIACIVATFSFVSYDFFKDLNPASIISTNVYNYTNDLNSNSLVDDIDKCSSLTNSVLSRNLNAEQKTYLSELSLTIQNLNDYMKDLSTNLVKETKKNSKVSQILNSIENLSNLRNELLFELNIYSVKMSGNTIGDPVGSFALLLEDVFIFTTETNYTFSLIHEYVSTYNFNLNQTKLNIYDIYLKSVNNLKNNYDKENLTFNNHTFKTLEILNNKIVLENNNIKADQNIIGGLYSNTAMLFNLNYDKVNKEEFVKNFHLKSYQDININTEENVENITYYYLISLLGVN